MRLVPATKREVDMNERKLLFLMTAEQADAFARLVESAGRGDGGAACRLGDMYREGLGGLRYSPKETYRWYAKSALAGDPNGQSNLGACYEHGLGCAQSYVKAVKWYRLSVAQGLSTASMNLGYCYLRGHGVPADKEEALRLFREAAARGEKRAADELERLGEPVTADTAVEPGRVQFIEAEADEFPKFIGLINIHPNGLGDETQIGRQAEQVVKIEQEAESRHAATEQDLFPIFAEGGLKPEDLVKGVAERYRQYLERTKAGSSK
jgi:hypothetical protein